MSATCSPQLPSVSHLYVRGTWLRLPAALAAAPHPGGGQQAIDPWLPRLTAWGYHHSSEQVEGGGCQRRVTGAIKGAVIGCKAGGRRGQGGAMGAGEAQAVNTWRQHCQHLKDLHSVGWAPAPVAVDQEVLNGRDDGLVGCQLLDACGRWRRLDGSRTG